MGSPYPIKSVAALDDFTAYTPPIRSSDDYLIRTSPFTYFLNRRLGIADPLYYSEALSLGDWSHCSLAHFLNPNEPSPTMRLPTRLDELKAIAGSKGSFDFTEIIDRTTRDCHSGDAFFRAATQFKLPGNALLSDGLGSYLKSMKCLATELYLLVQNNDGSQLLAQIDVLLYSESTNTLWPIDLKTTAWPCSVRASTCPFEFQTLHYLNILNIFIQQDVLRLHFNLPIGLKLGAFAHVTIQKPAIRFCDKDRDYTEAPWILKSGPRKGETELRRTYVEGPPRPENFIKRLLEWQSATGEYTHEAATRLKDPPVNISFTPLSALHSQRENYDGRLARIHHYATIHPRPEAFPKISDGMMGDGGLNCYAPFYNSNPNSWHDIMDRTFLTFCDRDLTPPPSNRILIAQG